VTSTEYLYIHVNFLYNVPLYVMSSHKGP